MDGFEVLKQVREHPEISKIPFIFLSAAINEENVQKGLDLGANAFLAKPFHFQQIMSHIRAYLP
jgi:DNA-binding response OmpR family regulator